jgi:hypothetical protein
MVPNQDYGEESPGAKRSRGSLWCEKCVAGHCSATAVLPVPATQVSCGEQPP